MMVNVYRFADLNIAVSSVYEKVHSLCRDYVSKEGAQDFSVTVTQADIDFERERSDRESETEKEKAPVPIYSDPYLETLAVYRKIAEKVPEYDTILVHGSCIAADGMGYLFAAKSGTGKSTHARLWRELLGDRAVMVNDDKPLIRLMDSEAWVYGTPWDGKHRLSSNMSVPLKAICFLERGPENVIRKITKSEAYPLLLGQVYRPMESGAVSKTLSLIDRLAGSVTLWRLSCNMDIEAAKVAYEAMRGE